MNERASDKSSFGPARYEYATVQNAAGLQDTDGQNFKIVSILLSIYLEMKPVHFIAAGLWEATTTTEEEGIQHY